MKCFPPRCAILPSNCTLLEANINNDCVLMMDVNTDDSIIEFLNEGAEIVST